MENDNKKSWESFLNEHIVDRNTDNNPYSEEEQKQLMEEFAKYDDPEKCPHNHVYPRLGFENSFIGEYCTQCGSYLDNNGNIVRNPLIVSSKELDRQGASIEWLTSKLNSFKK